MIFDRSHLKIDHGKNHFAVFYENMFSHNLTFNMPVHLGPVEMWISYRETQSLITVCIIDSIDYKYGNLWTFGFFAVQKMA